MIVLLLLVGLLMTLHIQKIWMGAIIENNLKDKLSEDNYNKVIKAKKANK